MQPLDPALFGPMHVAHRGTTWTKKSGAWSHGVLMASDMITNSKPLIINGNSLGGSVASLFTLSLLEKINFLTTKRQLCITFGSPLIGNEGLQEAISKYAAWNSCFLHVVSDQDPVPRVLISQTGFYKPFGMFLLCSKLAAHTIDINAIITKIENQEKKLALFKKQVFDPSMKLNKVKVHMANLEWYKKVAKDNKIGYYDSYKNESHTSDLDVVIHTKTLTCYWEELVNEVEKRPQTVGASLRTGWLFGGTNYRRMIEPLDIADYYNKGKTDYLNRGRPKHYIKLEQWLNETAKPASVPNDSMKQNVASILTEDSCFWARVEEALISCKMLTGTGSSEMEKQSSRDSLFKFENYAYGLMKNYAVSPEIFLQGSSFMQWWREYEKIMGTSYSSDLTKLMKDYRNYDKYATGSL
ncbi:senescence-associated carboxylesterase 101 [Quercus suber]|uniref:Senescence-associated carboxylesterase 101 n=1 Tax=Quercus suber TaxID=58331 RepID=A0AAW0M832_QUESU